MDENKLNNFDQFYAKNLNLLKVLGAPENKDIYSAFWNARNDEIEYLRKQVSDLNEVVSNQDKKLASFQKTERILKKEIASTGDHLVTLNENINLQGHEIEKLETTLVNQERVANDLRFVISEQKVEKELLSETINEYQTKIAELSETIINFQKRENEIKNQLQDLNSRTQVIEQTSREQIDFLVEKNEQLKVALSERDEVIEQANRYTEEYRSINTRLSDELLRMRQKVKTLTNDGPSALIDCH